MGEVSKRSADLLCFPRLSEAEGLNFIKKGGVTYVTRQRVTEQTFCSCVICMNARIADQGFRVDPAASFIDESDGFYFWKKVSDGCAWDAWKGCCLAVGMGFAGKWWRE